MGNSPSSSPKMAKKFGSASYQGNSRNHSSGQPSTSYENDQSASGFVVIDSNAECALQMRYPPSAPPPRGPVPAPRAPAQMVHPTAQPSRTVSSAPAPAPAPYPAPAPASASGAHPKKFNKWPKTQSELGVHPAAQPSRTLRPTPAPAPASAPAPAAASGAHPKKFNKWPKTQPELGGARPKKFNKWHKEQPPTGASAAPEPAPAPAPTPAPAPAPASTPAPAPAALDLVRCATCDGDFGLRIYQCASMRSHSSCARCREAGAECGRCGQPVTDMRNYDLQRLFEEKCVPCGFAAAGCGAAPRLCDLQRHERGCGFAPRACPRAPCTWTGHSGELEAHFLSCHADLVVSVNTELSLPAAALQAGAVGAGDAGGAGGAGGERSVRLLRLSPQVFLVHMWVDEDSTVRLAVQSCAAGDWVWEWHVYNKAEPRRKYVHRAPCAAPAPAAPALAALAAPAALPAVYARSFVNRGVLNYKLFVKSDGVKAKRPGGGPARGAVGGPARGAGGGPARGAGGGPARGAVGGPARAVGGVLARVVGGGPARGAGGGRGRGAGRGRGKTHNQGRRVFSFVA